MLLYFNGDSFVAGSELGDDILNIYPGFNFENVLCPGGHFSEPVHDRTAEKIVEILQNYEQHR